MIKSPDFVIRKSWRYFLAPTVLRCLSIVFLPAVPLVAFTQNQSINFEHIENTSDLSNSNVTSIIQDHRGFMWFGTFEGLNKYDGYHFTVYKTIPGDENSLSNNGIKSIIDDKNDLIWVGTWGGGLNKFDREKSKFKYFKHNLLDTNSISSNFVTQLLEDRDGNIWIGTGDGGLDLFDQTNNKFIHYIKPNDVNSLGSACVTSIVEDSNFNLWIGATNNGVLLINKKNKAITRFLHNGKVGKSLCDNDGGTSSDTVSIQLVITPPFWLTWWFKLFVLAAIAGVIVGIYKFRLSTMQAQKRKLLEKVDEQTRRLTQSTNEEQQARREAEKARYQAEQANKELKIKNKEIEEFAYIVSHDLQEPLRTISSFVGFLRKQYTGTPDPKTEKYFTFIIEASDRMKALIKNLLDYSRIGNKKELERVDCDKLIQNVLDDLEIAISEAGASITHDPLPVINGYPTELKQLFQNLVTNAIKFRRADTVPEIDISVQKMEGFWQFAVKDNGIGIPEKFNEKIFVIFQRLHTRSEYEGSGIGLSHCKKIVELHKGKIWVEPATGGGSIFKFILSGD